MEKLQVFPKAETYFQLIPAFWATTREILEISAASLCRVKSQKGELAIRLLEPELIE